MDCLCKDLTGVVQLMVLLCCFYDKQWSRLRSFRVANVDRFLRVGSVIVSITIKNMFSCCCQIVCFTEFEGRSVFDRFQGCAFGFMGFVVFLTFNISSDFESSNTYQANSWVCGLEVSIYKVLHLRREKTMAWLHQYLNHSKYVDLWRLTTSTVNYWKIILNHDQFHSVCWKFVGFGVVPRLSLIHI